MSHVTRHLSLPVTGMTCAGCASRISRDIGAEKGVDHIDVNLALERAELDYDPATTSPEVIAARIRDIGFGVRQQQASFAVTGMSCANCAAKLQRNLIAADGVIGATVNIATEQADIQYIADQTDEAALISVVENTGYQARNSDTGPTIDEAAAEQAKIRRDFYELLAAMLLTAPLMVQMGAMLLKTGWHLPPLAEFLLTTPVLFYIGRRFFSGAFMALKNRSANMDVLVSIGATAAWAWSCWLVLRDGHMATGQLYFEAAAVIVTLVLLGKYLENRAKKSASEALRQLMNLRPEEATIWRAGKEEVVPVNAVSLGDIVIVKPGERVPVDGIITRGDSEFDESLITGESLPVAREKGDQVVAGAINGNGLVKLRAERIGKDTTLARIADLVAKAQTGKAPIQRLVDRISMIFVPIVVSLSVLTFLGWWLIGGTAETGLIAAISVLVIACPCALGLATPTALVAGTGSAARHGILIRDIESLERASDIDHVAFDKTGTLTEGHPVITGIYGMDNALYLAASVQRGSEHPLARAFLTKHGDAPLAQPDNFRAVTGEGVEAIINEQSIRLGRRSYVSDKDVPDDLRDIAKGHADQLQIWMSVDTVPVALFLARDVVRPSSAVAIKRLLDQQVSAGLLTGDRKAVADAIGKETGIGTIIAEARPEDKATEVAKLQAGGLHVAMTGDGVNDAPALAVADLGIAMGSGSDIAMETAGVTLMRPDPMLVPAAIDIARQTRRVIRQNLFWAFIYNVIGIPIAAAGLLNPAVAGAAMALSSISVVSNSLRLKRWQVDNIGDMSS